MEQFSFPFQRSLNGQLPVEVQQLIVAARNAAQHAYAPYSNFKVGVAVRMKDGRIITGANHENASYPAGTCAERGVLANINPNDKQQEIKSMAVTYLATSPDTFPISPCGICRQTILEQQLAQGAPITVYMCNPDGEVVYVEDATSLLPFYFSSKNLGK
ncbi:MAG: cytidine deaminase [Taibaiella sp.]|nr:cytidine deaminase [Taibaiella sp.]